MAVNVQIESRYLIKPSIPTSPNLRSYKIGYMDELAPSNYISVVLFFSADNYSNPKFVARLEKSFAKTLTRLYPLAGRYVQEMHTIDCNDQGAEFIHTKVDVRLQDILESQWNYKLIEKFIPYIMLEATDHITCPLLATQVNTFRCEGIALGVSISHKIADASTLCTFLNEWAAINREDNETEFTWSGFSIPAFFPGRGQPLNKVESSNWIKDDQSNLITKKLSFSDNELSKMKAQWEINEKNGIHHLSRVNIVSAIIWKSLVNADRAIHNHSRDSILFQVLNLRGRTASLIPKDSCGNLVVSFTTKSSMDETTQRLAYLLSNTQKELIRSYSNLRHESEEGQLMVVNSPSPMKYIDGTALKVLLSSWCKFPFYEADFGFGKPVWVTIGRIPAKHAVVLIDGMGGNGIDVYVGMELNAFPYFVEATDMVAIGKLK